MKSGNFQYLKYVVPYVRLGGAVHTAVAPHSDYFRVPCIENPQKKANPTVRQAPTPEIDSCGLLRLCFTISHHLMSQDFLVFYG